MDDPRTDEQLVVAMDGGDVQAFEILYRRHRDWVVNLAYRFTGDRDLALDVMQETFTYVLGKFPGFELTSRFTTFLYPVVRHLAIDAGRKARRESTAQEDQLDTADAGPDVEPDAREELAAAMGRLSKEHREVVLIRFVDGFSLQEVADALRIPVGTVKSRLHHAIRILRADPEVKNFFEP